MGDDFDPFSLTDGNEPVRTVPAGFYYTDAITDRAVDRIRARSGGPDPFFLYVAYTAPHWPLHALPEDIRKYEDAYRSGWDEVRRARRAREADLGVIDPHWMLPPREPEAGPWQETTHPVWEARRMAVYAAQIDRLDQGVGRILAALRAAGAAEETLVLFLSDNGGCAENVQPDWYDVTTRTRGGRPVRVGNIPGVMPGPEEVYQSYGPAWANVSNTPFRRYKHFAHEGGIATPLIVRWPSRIQRGGEIRKAEVGHVIDLLPTFLEVAGAPYPALRRGQPTIPLEGRSMLSAMLGKPSPLRAPIFWEHEGNRAVRSDHWKLVATKGGPWELYDMSQDRTETQDLGARYPDRVRELAALYEAWAERIGVVR